MARLSILGVCLISALAINFMECSTLPSSEASGFKVRTVESIDEILKENPEIELQPLNVIEENVFYGQYQFNYTFGKYDIDDYIVANYYGNQTWTSTKNHEQTLRYPTGDRNISYLEVLVEQSSSLGRAYITGGPRQTYIEIVIEAQNTSFFNYSATIYANN